MECLTLLFEILNVFQSCFTSQRLILLVFVVGKTAKIDDSNETFACVKMNWNYKLLEVDQTGAGIIVKGQRLA